MITHPRWSQSLKARILVSYSLILILGGLSTSAIGIRVTGRALLQQARQQMVFGLSAAHSIYAHRQQELRLSVELLASSGRLHDAIKANQPQAAAGYLTGVRRQRGLDFLTVVDSKGTVIVRTSGTGAVGDVVAGVVPINRALQGESAASTELVPLELLRAEDPALAERAVVELVDAPTAESTDRTSLNMGMVLFAAAPVTDGTNRTVAVVYAGRLLSNPAVSSDVDGEHWMIGDIDAALSSGLHGNEKHRTAVTVFQDDVRITTNIAMSDEKHAVGTCVARDVHQTVIVRGDRFIGRVPVADDWYVTAYEPIANLAGDRIGMLGVGVLEMPYTAVRNDVTVSFAAIALFCFLLIIVVTYFLTRSLLKPVEEMASVSQSISSGDLSRRVCTDDQSELGMLSSSFNQMLDRISTMKSELEQWGKTLEHKVEERTQQLVKVQTQVARQQRLASVGQLAAGVAHEINNPLGGILTFATLVLGDLPQGNPHREDMEEIVQQAVRCRKIVTGLLEFSRQRESQMNPADINEIISRTFALLEPQALFYDIKVLRRLDPHVPMAIMDESQIQQVFMNIILNAVHAMEEHGELTIETYSDKEQQYVTARITDTGCGIAPEHREAIFDPFFTTKDPGKGTGLGLAVACRIIQAHGGRVDVESEVGHGTTFTITLPVNPPPSDEDQPEDKEQV